MVFEVAQMEAKKAQAATLPTLDLTGNLNMANNNNTTTSAVTSFRTTTATVGLSFNMPLFSGYAIENRIKEALALEEKARTDLEAAAFRRLVAHLQERTDVQNIDLMNLAGFCRNCLSRWYREEAGKQGIEIADPKAREIVYGMPYDDWKAKHQKEASGDQKKAFDKAQHKHG